MGKAWRSGRGSGTPHHPYDDRGRPNRGFDFKERDFGMKGGRRARARQRHPTW